MQNIKSPTYGADTPKHMRSDHTNMAACFVFGKHLIHAWT